MADDLNALEDWLGDYLASLDAAPMRRLSMQIMREVRKANAKRIAANVQPDGTAMAARKPRKNRQGQTIRSRAKMFRKLRLTRTMQMKADADGGELSFKGKFAQTAAEHHFGQTAFIGRTPGGRTIRARMTERRLFGFNDQDRAGIWDAMVKHLDME